MYACAVFGSVVAFAARRHEADVGAYHLEVGGVGVVGAANLLSVDTTIGFLHLLSYVEEFLGGIDLEGAVFGAFADNHLTRCRCGAVAGSHDFGDTHCGHHGEVAAVYVGSEYFDSLFLHSALFASEGDLDGVVHPSCCGDRERQVEGEEVAAAAGAFAAYGFVDVGDGDDVRAAVGGEDRLGALYVGLGSVGCCRGVVMDFETAGDGFVFRFKLDGFDGERFRHGAVEFKSEYAADDMEYHRFCSQLTWFDVGHHRYYCFAEGGVGVLRRFGALAVALLGG